MTPLWLQHNFFKHGCCGGLLREDNMSGGRKGGVGESERGRRESERERERGREIQTYQQ
jgi:hypothetical protein